MVEGRAIARPPRLTRLGAVHWGGLWSLYAMEVRRYFRLWQISVAGPGITALLYLTVISAALGAARASEAGAFLVSYVGTGMVVFTAIERATGNLAFSFVIAKLERTIEELLMSPVGPGEMIAGYIGAAVTGASVTGLAVALPVCWVLGIAPAAPLVLLAFIPLTTATAGGIGLVIGLLSDKFDHLTAWLTFVVIPLTFFSGVFAPMSRLPEWLQTALLVSPYHHALEGMRYGFFGEAGVASGATAGNLGLNAAALGLWLLLATGAGWLWLRRGYRLKS